MGTNLRRSWAAEMLTDGVSGLDQEENRRRHATSVARVAKSRGGDVQTARAEEPGVEELQDYRLTTVEGR